MNRSICLLYTSFGKAIGYLWKSGVQQCLLCGQYFQISSIITMFHQKTSASGSSLQRGYLLIVESVFRTGRLILHQCLVYFHTCVQQWDVYKRQELQRTRGLFFLMFLLRGIPFVDLAYLKKHDIDGNVIDVYKRQKLGIPSITGWRWGMKAMRGLSASLFR